MKASETTSFKRLRDIADYLNKRDIKSYSDFKFELRGEQCVESFKTENLFNSFKNLECDFQKELSLMVYSDNFGNILGIGLSALKVSNLSKTLGLNTITPC